MAYRYLLESGGSDNYLLEDGTGALAISYYEVGTPVEFSRNATSVTTVDAPNFTAVAGDTLLVVVSWSIVSTTVTLSDTVGSNDTWTQVESGVFDSGSNTGMRAFLLSDAAAGSCTIRATFANSINFPAIYVVPISGLAASPYDDAVWNAQSAPGTGTDAITSTATNTLTPNASNAEMIFGLSMNTQNNAVPNAGTGFTSIGSTFWNYEGSSAIVARAEHKRVTATTGVAATFTAADAPSGSTKFLTMVLALKEYIQPEVRSMTADAGSYSVSGQAATLTYTIPPNATPSHQRFGQNAALILQANQWARFYKSQKLFVVTGATTLVAEAGSYSVAGQTATLRATRKLTSDAGSYSLSGQIASLKYGHRLASDAGSYSVSGQVATLRWTHVLDADAGSYALSGQAATLRFTHLLTASAGSYSLSGQVATLRFGKILTAVAGSYSVSGQAATLRIGHRLSSDAGAYALSGQTATLRVGHSLDADAGSYSLSGQTATLSLGKVLTASGGTYSLSGQTASLFTGHRLSSDAGSYAVAGQTATLRMGHLLDADAGSYSLSGQAAALAFGKILTASAGAYSVAGQAATLSWTHRLESSAGAYTVTGQDAALTYVPAVVPVVTMGRRVYKLP